MKQYVCQGCKTIVGTTWQERDKFYDRGGCACGSKVLLSYDESDPLPSKKRPTRGQTPTKTAMYLDDYRKFEAILDADKDETLKRVDAQVLTGDGESEIVQFGCSVEDYAYLESLKRIIVKAYGNIENRLGPRAMSQDNPSLMDYGAGPESTVKLHNIVAQRMTGTTDLIYNQGEDAYPLNRNWLDLRRSNIAVGEMERYDYGQ